MIFLLDGVGWLVRHMTSDIQPVPITTRRTYYHWLAAPSTIQMMNDEVQTTDTSVAVHTVFDSPQMCESVSRLWMYSVHIVQLYL